MHSSTGVGLAAELIAHNENARHIARTAAQLFATRGYDATSVRDICEAAQITKPTLYYYFESKHALAEALLTAPLARLVSQMHQISASPRDGTSRLVALMEAQFAFCHEDPDRARFAYAVFFGPAGGNLSGELSEHGKSIRALTEQAVQLMVSEGVVTAPDAEPLLATARGLVSIYTMDYLYRGLTLESDLSRRLIDGVLRGFGVCPEPQT